MKKDNNTFTTLQAKIAEPKEEESDLSDSNVESHANLLFLLKYNHQGLEPKDNTYKQTILYNDRKNISMHKKLDMRILVLLDNGSTMDLFCKPDLVEYIKR